MTDNNASIVHHDQPQFRFGFVAMLFTLTVGQIAIEIADVVNHGPSLPNSLPAYTHLLLALVVVSTSWVGWSLSRAPGGQQDVRGVFDRSFIVLMIDVVLVIFYFILVRTVEIERPAYGPIVVRPSAVEEARWITVIFATYCGWDLVTKAFFVPVGKDSSFIARTMSVEMWRRAGASLVCFLLAIFAWSLVNPSPTVARVVSDDFALIALVLMFRALKDRPQPRYWVAGALLAAFLGLIAYGAN